MTELSPEVMMFAQVMEERLQCPQHEGGWADVAFEVCVSGLLERVGALVVAAAEWRGSVPSSYDAVLRSAADVAVFALIAADLSGALMRAMFIEMQSRDDGYEAIGEGR